MQVTLCLKCGVVECNLNYGLFSIESSSHPGCVNHPLEWPFVCANFNWYYNIKERNYMVIWCSRIYRHSLMLIIHYYVLLREMFHFLFLQRVTLSWICQDCPIIAHSAVNPSSLLSLRCLIRITSSVWVMEKDLLISLIFHSEKQQKLIHNASCAGMNEWVVLFWFDNRYKYWGNASPMVTVVMSSDGACGWGMNDFQYFVWNVNAMIEATEWSCKFYMKREVGGREKVWALASIPLPLLIYNLVSSLPSHLLAVSEFWPAECLVVMVSGICTV